MGCQYSYKVAAGSWCAALDLSDRGEANPLLSECEGVGWLHLG